jgi:hypothetical protein
MRRGFFKAPLLSPVQNVDFYGPKSGNLITKESFLQGRGQTLSKCPYNEVISLPNSLFFDTPNNSPPPCERVDMLPSFTRLNPVCNGIRETDITQYFYSPEKFQKGYTGFNSVVCTNQQNRLLQPNNHADSLSNSNYGSFETLYDLTPYQ